MKFSIPGFFLVKKILIYVGIFWRIQNILKLSFCKMLLMKKKMFLGVSSVVSEKALIFGIGNFFWYETIKANSALRASLAN